VAELPGSGLAERLAEVADEIDGVEGRAAGDAVEYVLHGVVFSVVGIDRAEFRLKPDIADAALGTPDVQRSSRGAGWVELAPRSIDAFAVDRAESWFESAARLAASH